MALLPSASLILLTSIYAQLPCETIFFETAAQGISKERLERESNDLWELSQVACETNNPDIIWKIASVETNFQFNVIRFNKSAKVIKGEQAKNYLGTLAKHKWPINADLGVMQMNWYWHKQSFNNDPYKIVRPRDQVDHLITRMIPMITKYCKRDWIGCYHNPANGSRAKHYNRAIKQARKRLERAGLKLLAKFMPQNKNLEFTKAQMVHYYDVANNSTQGPLKYKEQTKKEEDPNLLGQSSPSDFESLQIKRTFDLDTQGIAVPPTSTL